MLISEYITPVMYLDPSGLLHWAWKLAIGVGVLALVALTVTVIAVAAVMFSATAVLGTALSVSIAALTTGCIAASMGFVFGGISSTINDESYIEGASDGFMWGSIVGVVSGAASNLLGLFTPESPVAKLVYNMVGSSIVNGGITAVQGLVTDSFSWDDVYFSCVFSMAGGIFETFDYTTAKQIVFGIGLTVSENGILILIDVTSSIIRRG